MPFFKSMPANAGPGNVFSAYPEIYRHWAEMGQALINGPSPLSPAEREMIQAYVAGLLDCRYAHVAHTAAAVARGIEDGLIAKLIDGIATCADRRQLEAAAGIHPQADLDADPGGAGRCRCRVCGRLEREGAARRRLP